MDFLNRPFRWALLAGLVCGNMALAASARAADYDYSPGPPSWAGVPCDVGWAGDAYQALPAWWTSAWLGHFSGGVAHYDRQEGVVAMIWGDEKRCFPSYGACNAWVAALRRKFHRPEGYWTCLPLR